MSELSKQRPTALKLPQLIRGRVFHHPNTDRKRDRHVSTNPTNKLAQSQVPDRFSKRYELERQLRRKDFSKQLGMVVGTNLRSQVATQAKKHVKQSQNQEAAMRESKMLLFKNMELTKKKRNLGYLLEYSASDYERQPVIVNRYKRVPKQPTEQPQNRPAKPKEQTTAINCQYRNAEKLEQLDFLKLFILEQLVYYLSQSNNRSKEEMLGFCRIYLENSDKLNSLLLPCIFKREEEIEKALLLEKLGLYVILLLSTDLVLSKTVNSKLKSAGSYLHSSNLIILDVSHFFTQLLMSIAEYEKASVVGQFHVFNTMRFNQQRRKLQHDSDAIDLLSKNTQVTQDILRSVVSESSFESLKNFVIEILQSKASFEDKYEEVMFVLLSLEQIMSTSLPQEEVAKPEPPFLPPTTRPYTLVLDLDQTLIHFKEVGDTQSFLVRPYCHEFLREMSKHYQLVIFTASVKQYADTILDVIDKDNNISHRLYRQHTRLEDYVSIKDLSMLGRDLTRTIIVDNIPSNFKLQPRNGIYITTWTGEQQDCCLLNLMPVLQILVRKQVPDVRAGLQQISRYMEQQLQKSEQVDLEKVKFG